MKNKISLAAEQKQTHTYKEDFDSCQMGRVLRGGCKGEGIKKNKFVGTE